MLLEGIGKLKKDESKQNMATDLSNTLVDFLQSEIISKIMYAKGFQSSTIIQKKVSDIVKDLLSPYNGPNATRAIQNMQLQIEDAEAALNNSAFGWYVNAVSPKLMMLI